MAANIGSAKYSGCAVSVSSAVFSSSTVPPARSTSTSTTSCTTSPRVTPSSTSVLSLNTYVAHTHDIMIVSDTISILKPLLDPQGQGREGSRPGSQGGDGRQACEDQGCAREEAGACRAEEAGVGRWRRGVSRTICGMMNILAWAFLPAKEASISFPQSQRGICGHVFMYVRVLRKSSSLHARSTCPGYLLTQCMNVHT